MSLGARTPEGRARAVEAVRIAQRARWARWREERRAKPSVTIAGDVTIRRELLTEEQIAADWLALSIPNPARVKAERHHDGCAWRLPERLSLLMEDGDVLRYPVVRRDVWEPSAKATGASMVDARPTFAAEPLPYRGELFAYQRAAVDALTAHPCGVLVGPPGCGKGEMVAAIVGRVGLPTLVVVGAVDLANDLAARLHARLGVTVGRIGAGVFDVQRITVATIQSLDRGAAERIASSFGCLIVDECHHAAADTYRALSSALAVRRRYGFTATPRQDGLQPFVDGTIGETRHVITRAALEAAGRSVAPTLVTVRTRFSFAYATRDDYGPLCDALVADDERNGQIVFEMVKRCRNGVLGAVITGRVEHAKTLASLLDAAGLRAAVLTGATPKKARTATLDAAKAGELDVLVATQLFDEGVDVPNLAAVALVFPARAEGRLTQRIGRALRVHQGKPTPVVLDFVDALVGVLAWQAKQRARTFREAFGAKLGSAA